MVFIILKRITKICCRPVKRSKVPLSEYAHVAYQIKGNQECRNMVANILPATPSPRDPGESN